jgi:histidyl-tRNA synthetase
MYYITPVFRYERPQSGRLREHHQFGVEFMGSPSPLADAEVIVIAKTLFDRLGINNLELNVNSIGCPQCRKKYNEVLKEYLESNKASYCETCKERMNKNPLRALDCKEKTCVDLNKKAPVVLDYLCDKCLNHHKELLDILDYIGIDFKVNPYIVRGLDYYTRTVFEFVSNNIGAQGTVCGGGRYDNLVESMGGKSVPAVGFGMGLERLIMVAENCGVSLGEEETPLLYVAPLGKEQYKEAFKIIHNLRQKGVSCETDYMDRSLKAQMKYADKKGYRFVLVLGENEIKQNKAMLKDMKNSGGDKEISLDDIEKYLI